ncbi:MAG: DegV family protein [Chloroflexota bacterium]|nr:DegV family protein [Chloroflexota bacterium]
MAVHIVTDSTSDIPRDLADALNITVIPLTITFGTESFRDGIDLPADEFYRRLQQSKALPTTSQPPPALFEHAYEHLTSRGEVVAVHLSHKFSGTVETARATAQSVAPQKISVVDSGSTSMALGMCVLAAARLAQSGGTREQCVAEAESVASRLRIAVAFETLEYLRRGGRIGRGRAFLGGLLRLKPILTVKDGEAFPVTRVRSRAKALDELFVLCATPGVSEAVVLHTTTPEEASELAQRARMALPGITVHEGRFGPALGVHGGPGMIGLAVVADEPEAGSG